MGTAIWAQKIHIGGQMKEKWGGSQKVPWCPEWLRALQISPACPGDAAPSAAASEQRASLTFRWGFPGSSAAAWIQSCVQRLFG